MEPVTAILLASTALSAIGSISEGNARAGQYGAQKQAHDYNADVAAQNAEIAWQQAGAREEAQRRRGRMYIGKQYASIAQAGIDPNSGSAADVLAQSAAETELDALNLRYEGDMQARGFTIQSEQERYQGRISAMNAKNARRSGYFGAASSIIGGAASYARNKPLGNE